MDILTKLIGVYNNGSESSGGNLAKQFLAHLNEIPHMSIYEPRRPSAGLSANWNTRTSTSSKACFPPR